MAGASNSQARTRKPVASFFSLGSASSLCFVEPSDPRDELIASSDVRGAHLVHAVACSRQWPVRESARRSSDTSGVQRPGESPVNSAGATKPSSSFVAGSERSSRRPKITGVLTSSAAIAAAGGSRWTTSAASFLSGVPVTPITTLGCGSVIVFAKGRSAVSVVLVGVRSPHAGTTHCPRPLYDATERETTRLSRRARGRPPEAGLRVGAGAPCRPPARSRAPCRTPTC